MKKYTIHCTTEQTRKALELGAPINTRWDYDGNQLPFEAEISIEYRYYAEVPTAEQMIGWLESNPFISEIRIEQNVSKNWFYTIYDELNYLPIGVKYSSSRKEATLAAIDATLEYLTNNKK